MPYEEKKIILKAKNEIKKTDFWNRGFLFINKKEKIDRSEIKTINDINVDKIYKYSLPTGLTVENAILKEDEANNKLFETTTKTFKLDKFEDAIIRKAMAKLDFYRFNNLKKYFQSLTSSKEFIKSLKNISVDVTGPIGKLNNLDAENRLKICLNVLAQLENEILNKYTEFKGTEIFVPLEIKSIVRDKELKINVGDYGDQEYGVPMRNAIRDDLRLNLKDRDWYVYDENYGTSEEKSFVKFIDGIIEELRKEYSEVYLLRNASLFKIYRFSDGKAMEPDFVLFLKKESSKKTEQYQLFVEPKGEHLIKLDKWKEDFLKEIMERCKIEARLFGENKKYKIIGLPFYTESRKNIFIDEFKKTVGLIST